MKYLLTLALLLIASFGFARSKPDTVLANRIKTMYKADQKWRKENIKLQNKKSEYDEETINANEAEADSLNLIEAKKIIAAHGYPGFDVVGEAGSNRFWAIVQHCDNDVAFQQQVLKLMYKQVRRNNASGENYAYLKDRVLVGTNQKQLYGTQLRYNPKLTQPPISNSGFFAYRHKA